MPDGVDAALAPRPVIPLGQLGPVWEIFMARSLFKAFALAPLLPAVLISVANGAMGAGWLAIPLGLLIYVPLAYGLMLLWGYPVVRGLLALGWLSRRAFGTAGALSGLGIALLLPWLMVGRAVSWASLFSGVYLPLCIVAGTLTGLLLWRLAFGSDAGDLAAPSSID